MVLPPFIRWKLKHIRVHLALDQYRYFVHTRNIRLILHLSLHFYSSFRCILQVLRRILQKNLHNDANFLVIPSF